MNIGVSPGVRTVVWKGVSDVGNLGGGGSGGISILDIQSSNCPIPCASGGVCGSNSSCICRAGFTGATCSKYDSHLNLFSMFAALITSILQTLALQDFMVLIVYPVHLVVLHVILELLELVDVYPFRT